MEARTVEKRVGSEVGFGLVGDPRGDHSCLSNLIEGLDGVTRRGLDSKSGKSEQRHGWERLIDVNTNTLGISVGRAEGLERERRGRGWEERGNEKRKIETEGTAGCL